jgi:hypothetical protein
LKYSGTSGCEYNIDLSLCLNMSSVSDSLMSGGKLFHKLVAEITKELEKSAVRLDSVLKLSEFLKLYGFTSPTMFGKISEKAPGIIPFLSLYIIISFCISLRDDRGTQPFSLERLIMETHLVRPVTMRAASYCRRSSCAFSYSLQLSQTTDAYSRTGRKKDI